MLSVVLTILTGVLYPLAVTGLAHVLFSHQSEGSLIVENGKILGSHLIGQPFADPKYFWGRLSATSPFPYNAAASGGSNLAPTNQALIDAVKQRIAALKAADPSNSAPIPVDLVTGSGSGLDPHISVAAAYYQAPRVVRVRKLPARVVQQLIDQYTEGRQWGIFGEPRVNVLELNRALDATR